MLKPIVKNFLGKFGVLIQLDQLRMHLQKLVNYSKNRRFQQNHPNFILPGDEILYETFRLDYSRYYHSGKETAKWLIDQYKKYAPSTRTSILDWGCGPARVVRHLPGQIGKVGDVYGSDFNADTIDWCRKNIPDVSFLNNNLDPPIKIDDGTYTFIYAISVFTHLAEDRHQPWIEELHRLLTTGGILLFTTQGETFLNILTEHEKTLFKQKKPVVRNNDREGLRIFSTFHPPLWITRLLTNHFEILEHQVAAESEKLQQDIWIVKKK